MKIMDQKERELEILKETIERERRKLDFLAEEGNLEEAYRQSLLLDSLIEQYLEIYEK